MRALTAADGANVWPASMNVAPVLVAGIYLFLLMTPPDDHSIIRVKEY